MAVFDTDCSPHPHRVSRPLFLEIDFASGPGGELLRSAVNRYGPFIKRMASQATSVFLLRSPWAPGLRFVGARTKPPGGGEADFEAVWSASGSGESLHDALASCMGEGIERLAPIKRAGDVALHASFHDVRNRVLPSAKPSIVKALNDQGLSHESPLGWIEGRVIAPGESGGIGHDVLLPADWCLRTPDHLVGLQPQTALSVGVAAGPDHDYAASRALLELVERDAAGLWWIGGRPGRAVALDQPDLAAIPELLKRLRHESQDRQTWLLDITTDIQIPCVAALSCGPDRRKLAYGLAARLSLADAASAAIFELCQTELAILLAETKLLDAGDGSLTPLDLAHLTRCADLDVDAYEQLHPIGSSIDHSFPPHTSTLSAVQDVLARSGIEAALVDLTRCEFEATVIRAIAPALQPMPSTAVTDRLLRTLKECGGGPQLMSGIDLI
jgi:ribosomal protein S12 methylthiotransferase accessory factor